MRGQVVVITGAGRGLGEGMARRLAAKGARLALLDRDPALVEKVASDLPDARAWTDLCQMVLASNAFLYVE